MIAIGASVYALYMNASDWAQEELSVLNEERDKLMITVEALREGNTDLRARVAILERAQQVEGKAYEGVDVHLRSLQDEVLALKEEVAFYRGIVSAGKEKGLKIQTFVVDKENSSGAYRFQLVLTQNLKRVKMISGTVKLNIVDEQNGKPRRLLLSDMSGQQANSLKFEFKFFQRIEGRFTLPDGFKPDRLQIQVVSKGKKPASVEKSFEWQGITG
jgi:acyl-CoA thioesterase FadM